jgi:small subunit ribosomal protein S3
VDKLREEVENLIDRKVNLNVVEIKNPDLDAQLVAAAVAEQLKKRSSFRRVMKMRCEATMSAGAKGIRVMCAGRLGGAELARSEKQMMGSIPLQTLQANVDYGFAVAKTKTGTIGVKVWIHLGTFGEEVVAAESEEEARPRVRRRGRR